MSGRGRFIAFEGIEGVGKSTQVLRLSEALRRAGREVVATREPGGTPLAEQIRRLVLEPSAESVPAAGELLLMFAARAVHTANLIRPSLERGAWVLCDRYTEASYAYQGAGRGIPDADIEPLVHLAQQGLEPDLTLLLDAEVPAALARARSRQGAADRIEGETVAFFERVRARYLARARQYPRRIRVIDASADIDAVAVAIECAVATLGAG